MNRVHRIDATRDALPMGYLTKTEAVDEYRVCPRTLEMWVNQGILTRYTLRNNYHVAYRRAELDEIVRRWIERGHHRHGARHHVTGGG
jgi:hypothetical protein